MFFTPDRQKTINDGKVLSRIAAGDPNAVQECLDKYGALVWSLAKKYTRTLEDAEDATQEIFLDLWQNAARFDSAKASEVTFISLIARRRLIDKLRKTSRLPNFQPLDDITPIYAGNSATQMQTHLDAKRAGEIFQTFREDHRKVMQLAIYEGLTHTEIANLTGIPLGTVKTLIRRGLQKVRNALCINENSAPIFAFA